MSAGQINWTRCSEQLPKDDVNVKVICRSNGKKIWDSNGFALNEVAKQHEQWADKSFFLEWTPFTDELWAELNIHYE